MQKKLTEQQTRNVRWLADHGCTQIEIALIVGVSQATIWMLLAGKNYREYKGSSARGLRAQLLKAAAKLTPTHARKRGRFRLLLKLI